MRDVLRLRRCCEEREAAVIEESGLTGAEYLCFAALPASGGIDGRGLARLAGLSPSRVSRVIDALTRRGLVRRDVDPADRRITRLAVSERGHRLRRRIDDCLARCDALLGERLSSHQLAQARAGVDLLLHALEAP